MERLMKTNLEKTVGYGDDPYTLRARRKILSACGLTDGEVYLLEGGTQTNLVAISAVLRSWQGVIAAESAHIAVHEAGAIEYTGHKVISLPSADGKLSAAQIEDYVSNYYADETYPHIVEPGMVYITFPTELGTLYSLSELTEISEVCRRYGTPLYLDGARLGYGLAAENSDVTLPDIARLCDLFYIGGTKVGALFGEALVIANRGVVSHMFSQIKQHGALMAKGRLLGLQFETLFEDDLYLRLARHAVDQAMKLKRGFRDLGLELMLDSPTNQQFVMLSNSLIDKLKTQVGFELWGAAGKERSAVRFVTDWSTTDADIDALLRLLNS